VSLERIVFKKKRNFEGFKKVKGGQIVNVKPVGNPITILTPRYGKLVETNYDLEESKPEQADAFSSSVVQNELINDKTGYEFHAVQYYRIEKCQK